MTRFTKEDVYKLKEAIKIHGVVPSKPRSKNSKKMNSIKRVKLSPEALREKIESIRYSRDYSFLSLDEPVLRLAPPPSLPLIYLEEGSEKKFKNSSDHVGLKKQTASNGSLKSSEATREVDGSYCKNKPQRYYEDKRSSREATKEDMKALRWIKEKERRERMEKYWRHGWEPKILL